MLSMRAHHCTKLVQRASYSFAQPFASTKSCSRSRSYTAPSKHRGSQCQTPRSGKCVRQADQYRSMRVSAAQQQAGPDQSIVERGQAVEGPPGPIVVCTRNNDLQGVLDSTPEDRREDLVFIQNGMLQPWLDARSLGNNTQALVYFAVSKKGETPIDGKTDANPEGLTAVTGKHAHAFAARLAAGDLSCKVLDKTQYKKSMLEKLIWICAVMLVGAKNGNISVGEVEKDHKDELSTLISELAASGEAELKVQLDEGVMERLLAYSRSVASFPTAVKEVPWRNGWFYDLSLGAKQEGKPDPSPTHSAWLKEVGAVE